MLRKPWESDVLNEDWVPEESPSDSPPPANPDTTTPSTTAQEPRGTTRRGYGTVKISAPDPKLTLNRTAAKTVQNGGTLIINDDKAITASSSVSSQGTVKANQQHLQWKKRTTDLFTPLQLETMFNAPNDATKNGRPSLVGAPLRRVSGRRTVRMKAKPPIPPSNLAPQRTASIKTNDSKSEEGSPLKRTQSDSSGQSNSMQISSHSRLFQMDYDAKTRNCLSVLASQMGGNKDLDKESQAHPEETPPTDKGASLRRMTSAPSINPVLPALPPQRPSSYRMLTPYPPTWQWLQAQVEADYLPPDTALVKSTSSDGSVEGDGPDVIDHEWLRQVAVEPGNASYLSNIDFLDDVNASRELDAFHPKSSSTLNFSPEEGSDSPSPPRAATPPSLWQELFLPERQEHGRGHLGPDRAADHLKRHGVLPHQVVSGELNLIKPSQVGQVPKQVNNMRFNSLMMKWEPIELSEEDPFVGVKTLAISPEELTKQLSSLKDDPRPTPRNSPYSNHSNHSPIRPKLHTPQPSPHSSVSKSTSAFRAALSPKNNALLMRSKVPLTTTQSLTQEPITTTTPIRLFPSSPRLTTVPASPKMPPKTSPKHAPPLYDQAFHGWFIPTAPTTSRPFLNPVTQATQTDPNDYLEPVNSLTPTASNSRSLTSTPPLSTPKASSHRSSPIQEEAPQKNPENSSDGLQLMFNKLKLPFQELRLVTLTSAGLDSVKEFSSLPNLKALDVSRNCIRDLDLLVSPRLLKLKADHNLLTRLPSRLGESIPKLERLEVSQNQILKMDGLVDCLSLKVFAAIANRITTVGGRHANLQVLKLSENPLESILPSACFSSLHTLYLNNLTSPLDILPHFEVTFPALENLSLRNTHVARCHPSKPSHRLRYIYAEGSPQIMPKLLDWSNCLAFLELRRCDLDQFPSKMLQQMPQLVALDLSFNQICRFNRCESPHPKLKWLNLAANRIANITELYTLLLPTVPHLKALDIRENPLGTSLGLNHPDPNIAAMYQAGIQSQLPGLIKLDGRRLA